MNEKPEGNWQINSEIFENKKTKFFSQFALSMRRDFQTLKLGGVAGLDAKKEGWRNVSEHCLVEAVQADILAEKLGLDREKMKTAALVHDWYKRRERETVDQKGTNAYNTTLQQDEQILRELGYSQEIINISKAVGHSSLKRMQESDVTQEEQVMHYIDDITAGSDIALLDDRIDKNEANPRYKELNEEGRKVFDGKTYFEVQREIGKQIECLIAEKLGIIPPEDLPIYLKKEINNKISTQE